MAIFTALVTATKVLASQGAKKAAVSAAKGVVKKKAKNFITGKGKKKKVSAIEKRSRGRGGYSSEPGAIVKTGSSAVTPFIEGVSKSSDTSSQQKQETKTESVSFESIAKQLTGIVTLTNTLESIVNSQYKTQKENTKQARTAAEKEKKREREEEKESKGSGIMSGIGGAIGAAGQKSGIFNFLTNILLGSAALGLLNNIGTLTSAFEFLKDNWSGVIGGIKTFALTFVNAKPLLIKAFSKVKQFTGKGFTAVKSGFSKLGNSFVKLFRKLGVFVPKYIKNSITGANKGIRAAVEAGRRLPEAARRFLTFDKRSDKLGASKKGLDKLTSGRGGTGSGSSRGIGEGFKRLSGGSSGKMARTLDFDVDRIRREYGDDAARRYQGDIDQGKTSKRALSNIKKNIKADKLKKAPMTGTLGGGKLGKGIQKSQLVKGGLKKTANRAALKVVGKGGVKFLKRIPIIGPLIVGIAAYLETGNAEQSLFRAGGSALGGALGATIAGIIGSVIPVLGTSVGVFLGTLLGELIGEYAGDLFYILLRGGGWKSVGEKLKTDVMMAFNTAIDFGEWIGTGLTEFYKGVPKFKLPELPIVDIGVSKLDLNDIAYGPLNKILKMISFGMAPPIQDVEFPNPLWFLNPLNIPEKAKLFQKSFFSGEDVKEGKVDEKKAEIDTNSDFQDRLDDAQTLQGIDTSQLTPELGDLFEANKEQNIKDGLVLPGLTDVYGKPLLAPTSSSEQTSSQTGSSIVQKVPLANLKDIGVGAGVVGKTSNRGMRGGRHHAGVDIGTSGEKGWYVAFKMKGKVDLVSSLSGYGKTVIINVGGLDFLFAHLASYNVKQGETYDGQIIGEIGNTGVGSGEHLHFEVRSKGGGSGTDIDPEPYIKYLEIGKKGASNPNKSTPKVDIPKPKAEVTPTEDKVPGITPPQKKDDAFVLKDANGNPLADIGKPKSDTEVPPPAPVLPPPPQMTPQSSPSVDGIETYDEPEQGSTAVIPIPQQSATSGGGGGGGSPMVIPGPSVGSLLNSYYKQQLLGFLYKQG